eukprot:TRINITY_DN47701_c0_g1_i1.p1 TRINITY_DN47701_c0_g1~~TRINITY_DN47701_c0_g1_i1.p1  ORF type:complete len:366 (-),score=93.19 TRINITY_DN47701_c0_g1_i1:120-1217(-)
MAPRKGESKIERADRLANRAYDLVLESKRTTIKHLLSEEAVVTCIEETLKRRGLWRDAVDEPKAKRARMAAICDGAVTDGEDVGADLREQQCSPAKSALQDEAPVPQAQKDGSGSKVSGKVDAALALDYGNEYQWGFVAVSKLSHCLQQAAPHIFTKANLSSLLSRGARKKNQETLSKYLELFANIQAHQNTPRAEDGGMNYVAYVCKQVEAYGNRGFDIVLPADWSKHGVYLEQRTGNKVAIYHRFLKVKKQIPVLVADGRSLYIEANWSEATATLYDKNDGDFSILLLTLFAQEVTAAKAAIASNKEKQAKKSLQQTMPKRVVSKSKPLAILDVTPPKTPPTAASAKVSAGKKAQLSFKPRAA